jgi:hypothetical protein
VYLPIAVLSGVLSGRTRLILHKFQVIQSAGKRAFDSLRSLSKARHVDGVAVRLGVAGTIVLESNPIYKTETNTLGAVINSCAINRLQVPRESRAVRSNRTPRNYGAAVAINNRDSSATTSTDPGSPIWSLGHTSHTSSSQDSTLALSRIIAALERLPLLHLRSS